MIIYTGRFQPFHNGHLSLIRQLRKEYPTQKLCLAVIKDVPFKKKTAFDKTVDNMLSYERNPFNAEITLSMIEETLKEEKIDNIIVTLMPRASEEIWPIISAIFDCERIWVFTKNQVEVDEWEEKKCMFYQSLGEKVLRIPISKDINGSKIRKNLAVGNFESLKHLVPLNVYEYLKKITHKTDE